jgi:hypothetical protein
MESTPTSIRLLVFLSSIVTVRGLREITLNLLVWLDKFRLTERYFGRLEIRKILRMKKSSRKLLTAKYAGHRGQSMVEMAVALPLLIMLLIAFIEMGILFASYIALVNSAREGAFFASTCPELTDSSKDSSTSCTNDPSTTNIERYRARVEGDIIDAIANQLFEAAIQQKDSGCQDASPNNGVDKYKDCLKLDRPVSGSSFVGTNITVTVHYRIHTFTSDMSLPSVGRFGLPNYYQIDYSMGLPIRSGLNP